uniref:Septin-type G domain-containing protein n=1 Tax=Setaria digitata TaxID=48799 RepID=A0A915PPF4_9BILA
MSHVTVHSARIPNVSRKQFIRHVFQMSHVTVHSARIPNVSRKQFIRHVFQMSHVTVHSARIPNVSRKQFIRHVFQMSHVTVHSARIPNVSRKQFIRHVFQMSHVTVHSARIPNVSRKQFIRHVFQMSHVTVHSARIPNVSRKQFIRHVFQMSHVTVHSARSLHSSENLHSCERKHGWLLFYRLCLLWIVTARICSARNYPSIRLGLFHLSASLRLILNKKSKTGNYCGSTSTARESEESDRDRNLPKKNNLFHETGCSDNLERTSVRSIIAGYQQKQLSSRSFYIAQGLSSGNSITHPREEITSQVSAGPETAEGEVHVDVSPFASIELQKVSSKSCDIMESKKPMAAPPAPPLPPIPTHLKSSQLKLLNGSNGCSSPTSSNFSNGIHKRASAAVTSGSAQDSLKHEAADAKFISTGTLSRFPSGCFLQHLCCIYPNHKKSIAVADTSFSAEIQKHHIPGTTTEDFRTLKLNGHVGFDSLPHQLVRKCTERGFQFNLMCVGETGMGKTTLIESLFNMKLEFHPCNNELKTVELLSRTYDVVEGGIRLKLTIVETAGFGDQLDKDKSAQVIVDFINEQFEKYLKEELKIKRCLDYYDDTRIHACLYFISPTGHGFV